MSANPEVCPFCGAGRLRDTSIYECWRDINRPDRDTTKCYKRQLSQQTELLRRAKEVVKWVVKSTYGKAYRGHADVQALLPELEKALEGKE